jgi:hypothetical protein
MAAITTDRFTIFRLMPDATGVNSDLRTDAQVIPFDGIDEVPMCMGDFPIPVELPCPVEFYGLLSRLNQTDIPVNNHAWPLMSRRMLDVLKSVGSFSHYAIPTRIIEGSIGRRLDDDPRYDADGNLKPEFYNDEFVLLQLTEHIDALDLEKSEYEEYYSDINAVQGVDKYVFKEPRNGFPPIFRLAVEPVPLYISHEAKRALEEANIKGLWLTEVGE